MSVSLYAPVGRYRSRNATNRTDDTVKVQKLLAKVANKMEDDRYDPGRIDGVIEPVPEYSETVAAIVSFQKRFMRHPDGQIDPGRSTLRKLNSILAMPVKRLVLPDLSASSRGNFSLAKSFEGKGMAEICPSGHAKTSSNHCAHFVGHALDISVGLTCHGMTTRKHRRGEKASLRVQEVFAACPHVEEYETGKSYDRGLIFVSATKNFVKQGSKMVIRNVSKKHIGIYLNGTVWHYNNSRNKVVRQTPAEFIKHYSGQKNALWYGRMPAGAIRSFTA